ncbi:MAG: DUF2569 domain-containing protein [Hyphomicrobiaceae bacterium]
MTENTSNMQDAGALPRQAAKAPKGLGGWLILPLIGLVLTALLVIAQTILGVQEELANSGTEGLSTGLAALLQLTWTDWRSILIKDPASIPGLIMGLISIFFILLLIFGSLTCLVLMLRKSAMFPAAISIFYAVTAVLSVGLAVAFAADLVEATSADKQDMAKEAVKSVAAAGIWLPYFRVSKRVKNTFVR